MKKIKLKKVPMVVLGTEQTLEYKPLIQVIIETPSNQGAGTTIAEMRKSIRILDALEKEDDVLLLEDADYDYLKDRINSARFTSNNRVFIDFVDYINDPEPTPEAAD